MVYNAFPHFSNPHTLIIALAANVKAGGKLTIAHGSSREHIDHHQMENASSVSIGLMSDDELLALLSPYFEVTAIISDDRMQQIVGVKKIN